jgi:hypothetical protein
MCTRTYKGCGFQISYFYFFIDQAWTAEIAEIAGTVEQLKKVLRKQLLYSTVLVLNN